MAGGWDRRSFELHMIGEDGEDSFHWWVGLEVSIASG